MEREKALEMALGQIERQYGKGAIMKMGENVGMNVETISSGALAVDLALGVGGLPRGRVTEIFGPEMSGKTTLALHVVAEAQRNGGICAFIDAEHALDPAYARAIGIDVDELLISQPDTGEQALEITDMLIRSGALDVVVIDSVAALTPKAEIEGEMGDAHVGLQARLMSQALRKITHNLNKSKTICIFINQLREKIGVLFGCLSGDTMVTLGDGTKERIDKIVRQQLPVEVLSYDADLDRVVPKKIVSWFDNGPAEQFIQFTVHQPIGCGTPKFALTPNHQVRTPSGWREAQELEVGDRVMQAVPHHLSSFQWEVVLGTLMGDGALSPNTSGISARLRWGHSAKQADYGDWKASLFANVTVSRSINAKGAVFHDVQPLPELAELRRAIYINGKKSFSHDYLKALTPRSLAVWYMDDGGFTLRSKGLQERTRGGSGRSEICVEAMESTTRQRLRDYLADTWGIHAKLVRRGKRQISSLVFPTHETAKLHALIAPFVHPSMDYKLLPRYRGRFDVQPAFEPVRQELMPLPIKHIETYDPRGRSMNRFDIEVEGSHNYFAGGVMVHNSPETTPGGRALKFYSSVRLDVRRIEAIKDGVEVMGNRTRVKVVKNKCVAAGTTVSDPTTGLTHPIEDIVEGGEGFAVMAADKAGRLHVREIRERFAQGEQDVIGLGLGDGTELWVTPDHRVLTEVGWQEAGELSTGDRVARPWHVEGGPLRNELPLSQTEPVLAYLRGRGLTASHAAEIVGDGAGDPRGVLRRVLGGDRLQRDRVERIAHALGSDFLREVLGEELWYDPIVAIKSAEHRATYDIEVDELHNFVADGVVVHNCAPPFRQAEFDIMYGKGISREGSVLDISADLGIVQKSGAWYTYDDEQLGQGRENAKQFLSENPELMVEISERIRKEVYGDEDAETAAEGAELDELDEGDTADDEPITLD